MAMHVLLLSILFTTVLLARRSKVTGLELGLQFNVEPEDCIVSRNKPALLGCSSYSQQVSYTWMVDDRPVSLVNSSHVQLLRNGSLYFKEFYHKKAGHSKSDQGVYQCIIQSSQGALISRPAQLRFASMSQKFLEAGRSVSVVEGDTVWLPCGIDSLPPAHISWQHDFNTVHTSNRHTILNNGTLLIYRATKQDQGDYSCSAWNSVINKKRSSDVSVVKVTEKREPHTLELLNPMLTSMNWTLGERVSVACVANGSPTPLVKWTKSKQGGGSTAITEETQGVSILTVETVSINNSGLYTCVASQVESDANHSTRHTHSVLRVEHILTLPVITKGPESQELPTAKVARFPCAAEGYPPPEITWFRNGQKLAINGRIKLRNDLLVTNTVRGDTGIYQCMVTNSIGSVWAAARLVLSVPLEQPQRPHHLLCSTASSSSVNLFWHHDQLQGLQAFTVHYQPTGGGEENAEIKQIVPHEQNQTFTVEKLPPYTNFTFHVRSYNKFASSDHSEEIICQTGESVPRGLPKIYVDALSPTTVRVEWDALPRGVAQGVVTKHKVEWCLLNHPSTHVDTVPGHVYRYTISGLEPNSEYEVRVIAGTQVGWPNITEDQMPWTKVTTPPVAGSYPLIPSPTVTLTALNATAIQVHWSLVPITTHVQGFHLSYLDQDGTLSSPIQFAASVSEYILLYLEPLTWYEVRVRAVSEDVEGELGVKAVSTLPPLTQNASPNVKLIPPTGLEASPLSPFDILLAWKRPPSLVNVILFTVSYQLASTGVDVDNETRFCNSTSNEVKISGLKPFTLYELKVHARDDNNRISEYSQKLQCRTLQHVPEQVVGLEWKPLNTTSVQIFWKVPKVANGIIIGYTLSYTNLATLPVTQWTSLTLNSTKHYAELTGLAPNIKYSVAVRAATPAGLGKMSQILEVVIPARDHSRTINKPSILPPDESSDQFWGIVLGCAIGGFCVVLCTATLLHWRECNKPVQPQCLTPTANGAPCLHIVNVHRSEHHELQCLASHLDPKGGHMIGEMNGIRRPLLKNGKDVNSFINQDRNFRITENPQFVSCEDLQEPSEEGDSLLSGHSLNETHLTTESPAQVDKLEPDDGFHETLQSVVAVQ